MRTRPSYLLCLALLATSCNHDLLGDDGADQAAGSGDDGGGFEPASTGGNNAPCKADCYLDQDTGSGNDQCYWDHRCDSHEFSSPYDPEGASCKSSAAEAAKLKVGGLSCSGASQTQSKQCHD